MKNFDLIIELIDKKPLSTEDQTLLNNLLSDDENREFYNTYKKLGRALLHSQHLSAEDLGDYILIKNGLEPQKATNLPNILLFDQHLRRCDKCMAKMQNYNKELSDVENFLSAQFQSSAEMSPNDSSKITYFSKINFTRYALGISAVLIIFASLLLSSRLTSPKYFDLASVTGTSEISGSRGRTTDDFDLSIKALEEKDYKSAVEYLKSDIKSNKDEETIFYSYYLLGMTYLETSENNVLGLFRSFNKTSAEAALNNLKKTIELNTSGQFQNINLDSYFYAAKACLMLEDVKSAKQLLQIVVNQKGSKLIEAERILKALN